MFSTLPQSVRDEGWQAWEIDRMQRQDFNAPQPPAVTSDSETSYVSIADSIPTRRRKLNGPICPGQLAHLHGMRRKAQRTAYNARRSKEGSAHLDGLVRDISIALDTYQARDATGRFCQQ